MKSLLAATMLSLAQFEAQAQSDWERYPNRYRPNGSEHRMGEAQRQRPYGGESTHPKGRQQPAWDRLRPSWAAQPRRDYRYERNPY